MGPLVTYGEAAAGRVGAVLKTSDTGVYAEGIALVVLNCEQGVGGAAVVGDWLWKIIERVSRLLRYRSIF